MYMKKTHSKEMDSHLYRNVHDENPYTIIWIVIRTNMYMTKPLKNMDSHSCKHVHEAYQPRVFPSRDYMYAKPPMLTHLAY